MVLAEFLTGTRKRWLKAFKLFKNTKARKNKNRVSPTKSATMDASSEIDVRKFCTYSSARPASERTDSSYENASFCSNYFSCSSASNSDDGTRSSDSAFGSLHSTPVRERLPVCYATVTYFNVDSEDSCSIQTEYTLLEYEEDDEIRQNAINESIEITSSL